MRGECLPDLCETALNREKVVDEPLLPGPSDELESSARGLNILAFCRSADR